MKIGIFGDSFAFKANNNSWCALLEKNYKVEHFALHGTSIWNAYKKFVKVYSTFDIIIFCYSSHFRFHHLPKDLEKYMYMKTYVNFREIEGHLSSVLGKDQLNMLEQIIKVDSYTNDNELNIFIYQHVFNEINERCKNKNIKLINYMPFDHFSKINDKPIDIKKVSGSIISGINWVSRNEKDAVWINGIDQRACHLSIRNNIIVYELILNLLNQESISIIDAQESDLFVL